jgi:hypothetical protein
MAAPTLRATGIKRAGEIVSQVFDFSAVLVPGATLTGTPTVTAQAGLTVIGAPALANPLVTVQFSGGVAGNDYTLRCQCAASNGDTPELEVVILVREEN